MSDLTTPIMRRVYLIYWLRKSFSPTAVRLYGIVALVLLESTLVSFSNIVANLQAVTDLSSAFAFTLSALTHTQWLSLLVVALSGLLLSSLVAEIFKNLSQPKTIRQWSKI